MTFAFDCLKICTFNLVDKLLSPVTSNVTNLSQKRAMTTSNSEMK